MELLRLIDSRPSCFHAIANVSHLLDKNGHFLDDTLKNITEALRLILITLKSQILMSHVSINCVDIGLPQFVMHFKDTGYMIRFAEERIRNEYERKKTIQNNFNYTL